MSRQILEGIKVADFSWAAVGPQVGRELAIHGATVVRVECHRRPDTARLLGPFKENTPGVDRSAFGTLYNANKLGMSVDLNRPRGKEVGRRLALWSDVVIEAMVPGTMKKWDLDYDSLSREKPELIYCSTSQEGQFGPYSNFGGYGVLGAALAGFSHLTGLPDREPLHLYNNQYTDVVTPWSLIMAVVGALRWRQKTGRGMYLDHAQIEAGLNFWGPALLDYQWSGRVPTRSGNRDPGQAPHGIYPCQGPDCWVAIAVRTAEQWESFCRTIGNPDWTKTERFRTLAGRKTHEDELDERVAEWTADRQAEEVMGLLQDAGVPAGIVQTGQDLFNDPQLAHRGHFHWLDHPVIGHHAYHAPAYRMSATPALPTSAAPCLGQHNEHVYRKILRFSEDEMAELLVDGVITTEDDLPGASEQ